MSEDDYNSKLEQFGEGEFVAKMGARVLKNC